MTRSRSAASIGPLAAALALALVGCGGGSDTSRSSATSPVATSAGSSVASAAPSLATQLIAVNDRLLAVDSYVATVTTPAYGVSTTVHHGEDRQKAVTGLVPGDTAESITVGDDTWVRGSEDFWFKRFFLLDPAAASAAAAPLVGRWVLVTGTRTEDFGVAEDRSPFSHPDDTTKTGTATIDGRTVDVYSDPIALTTVYLSTDGEPLPVKVEGPQSTVTVYSAFGTAPEVVAPAAADVVDGRALLAS